MNKKDHKSAELTRLFFLELAKIQENENWEPAVKAEALARLIELLFLEVTKEENIQFTTLFARIAYAGHKYHLEKKTLYWVHFFRKKVQSFLSDAEAPQVYELGLYAFAQCVEGLFGEQAPTEVKAFIPEESPFLYREQRIKEFRKKVRMLALQDEPAKDRFLAREEEEPSQVAYIQYNIADRNEPFNPTIRQIRSTFGFPVLLNLIDVEVEEGEDYPVYRAKAIVVEPDFLLDVTAIANCFQGRGAEPVLFLLQKFLPQEPNLPMTLGNIANFFLDELMNNAQATFKETFPKVFKTNPLTFALLSDAEVKELNQNSQKHWTTLKLMVQTDMRKYEIEPSECYLEPGFYDEAHGLQGRLDVFYKNENRSAIVELKSGQPFNPNRFGLSASHFIQTLMYDLMVRSVFGGATDPACYILYSGMEQGPLRFAPVVKAEQNEALQVRNQLMAIERLLANSREPEKNASIFDKIRADRYPQIKGFARRNIECFEKTYSSLGALERRYFGVFAGFIAREHLLAKTGLQGVERANGQASLWLDSFEEKEDGFQIIRSLSIKENRSSDDDPVIVFKKTLATNPLANFRTGDIAALYPVKKEPESGDLARKSPVTTQIFKVTILSISQEEVRVSLRYKQFNSRIFEEYDEWNIEHDQMDIGFLSMYQGLFQWAECLPQKQSLLLTGTAPARPASNESELRQETPSFSGAPLTEEQCRILEKMLSARDYFLLWGPPGTGKTSQMLRNYAGWIFENTDENLLLLAYTNRAVDEICEALESLGEKVQNAYLRIGSPYATGEDFQRRLLSSKIKDISTRRELRHLLDRHRIFVSTLASLSSSRQLLKLKKFKRVVVDEASQILEPVLVGLLPQFEQFILVGDHKQLPAVVVQDELQSAVSDEGLRQIGLRNLRNSLFERLYLRCVEQGWTWAYDHLSHQGRMHQEIMRFPADHFYEGKLRILPEHIAFSQKQTAPLVAPKLSLQRDWEKVVASQRLAFLSTPVDRDSPSRKTNRYEAALVAELVKFFRSGVFGSAEEGKADSIGIITPYRAQIAQIQEVLQNQNIGLQDLTVDTVERYQGGARDIVIISLCTNFASQMETLVSLSHEGVDRKLNVALTRARDRIVVIGNEQLLMENEVYRKLISWCRNGCD